MAAKADCSADSTATPRRALAVQSMIAESGCVAGRSNSVLEKHSKSTIGTPAASEGFQKVSPVNGIRVVGMPRNESCASNKVE